MTRFCNDEEDESVVFLRISTLLLGLNGISGFAAFAADCCGLPLDLGSLSHCGTNTHTHTQPYDLQLM